MRIQPAIGLLAVALAICLPGCSKNKLAAIDISAVRSAGRQTTRADNRNDSLMGDLQRERTLLEALRHDDTRLNVDRNIGTSKAARDIADRISDRLADWDAYRIELSTSSRLQSTPEKSAQWTAPTEANGEQIKAQDTSAIRRKYSADNINLHMRIALLESRLAAANEQDKKLLGEKLSQAKAALDAVDEAYQTEIKQYESSVEVSPESTPIIEAGSANAADQRPAGEYSISPRMRNFYSNAEPMMSGARLVRTSADAGYRKTLADTCNSIDQALLLLRRPKADH